MTTPTSQVLHQLQPGRGLFVTSLPLCGALGLLTCECLPLPPLRTRTHQRGRRDVTKGPAPSSHQLHAGPFQGPRLAKVFQVACCTVLKVIGRLTAALGCDVRRLLGLQCTSSVSGHLISVLSRQKSIRRLTRSAGVEVRFGQIRRGSEHVPTTHAASTARVEDKRGRCMRRWAPPRDALEGGQPPPPPPPGRPASAHSHCLPDGKYQLQWHL